MNGNQNTYFVATVRQALLAGALLQRQQQIINTLGMISLIQRYGFQSMGIIENNFPAMQTFMGDYYMQMGSVIANAYMLGREAAILEAQRNVMAMQEVKQPSIEQQAKPDVAIPLSPISDASKEVAQEGKTAIKPAPKPVNVKPVPVVAYNPETKKPFEPRRHLLGMDNLKALKDAIKNSVEYSWVRDKIQALGIKLKPLIDGVKLAAANFAPNVAQVASIISAGVELSNKVPEVKLTSPPQRVIQTQPIKAAYTQPVVQASAKPKDHSAKVSDTQNPVVEKYPTVRKTPSPKRSRSTSDVVNNVKDATRKNVGTYDGRKISLDPIFKDHSDLEAIPTYQPGMIERFKEARTAAVKATHERKVDKLIENEANKNVGTYDGRKISLTPIFKDHFDLEAAPTHQPGLVARFKEVREATAKAAHAKRAEQVIRVAASKGVTHNGAPVSVESVKASSQIRAEQIIEAAATGAITHDVPASAKSEGVRRR